MKRIGYIYKYREEEKKGILVYGHWKKNPFDNSPKLFSDVDCITKIEAGQLVYFELTDGKVKNIERASLANFDKNLIEEMISWKKGNVYDWYYQNTHISFENLNDVILIITNTTTNEKKIIYKNNYENIRRRRGRTFKKSSIYSEFAFDNHHIYDRNTFYDSTIENEQDIKIEDLYDCFGKYKHYNDNILVSNKDSIYVPILDISLWIDKNICKHKCFGENADELKFLYDVFVEWRKIDENGKNVATTKKNDCISPSWKMLLAKLSDNVLMSVAKDIPLLQPALPIEFCKKNLDILTDKYGMPSLDLCKMFCLHRIQKSSTISEYQELLRDFNVYEHCKAYHLEDEGIPMCRMGKEYIDELRKLLEEHFNIVIRNNIIKQFYSFAEKDSKINRIKEYNKEQIISIGTFIESLHYLSNDLYLYVIEDALLNQYSALSKEDQNLLYKSTRSIINKTLVDYANGDSVNPFSLFHYTEKLQVWIDDDTKSNLSQIANRRFVELNDLSELGDAYNCGYITRQQYYIQFKKITIGYSISELIDVTYIFRIRNVYSNEKRTPLIIQWYVVSNIIKSLGFKSSNTSRTDSFRYMHLKNYPNSTWHCCIQSLFKLFNIRNIDKKILKKAEQLQLRLLNDKEKWELFEKGIMSSPSDEIIRDKLDEAYKMYSLKENYFREECFQERMYKDIQTCHDTKLKLCIADNLDSKYFNSNIFQSDGVIRLFLWLKNKFGSIDLDLIKEHLYELPDKQQILLLRYVFYLIACKKIIITIDEMYEMYVESSKKACPTVCVLIYMLKKISCNLLTSITKESLDIIIGAEKSLNRLSFNNNIIDLFYSCEGFQAFDKNDYTDFDFYHSFNGFVDKKTNTNESFYEITFYEKPILFSGKVDGWSNGNSIKQAKSILENNLKYRIIDGKYIIPLSEEIELKRFVLDHKIDIKCSLSMLFHPPLSPILKLKSYEDSPYYICRCSNYSDVDPVHGLPFYWCKKKLCARNRHYIIPTSQWEKYKFADFLFIMFGMHKSNNKKIWKITSEISQFINDYLNLINSGTQEKEESDKCKISIHPIRKSEEVGIWTKDMSILQVIYDEDYYDEGGYDYDYRNNTYEEPTYGRYAGSYAQDEMGYSDDDIDTIFDGDPDAYWNID